MCRQVSSDRKNYMAPHRTRHLWKLPVRKALAVAASGADGGGNGVGARAGRSSGGKRARAEVGGDDVVMTVRVPHRR